MGRRRLAMDLISNKRARLTSFEKRKKGLKKAAYELSTLCGVEIGMIIVGGDDQEVWPQNWDTVAKITKMHKLGSSQDGKCKTYGVLDYLKEKREEVEQDIKKMREKARERKYATREDDEFERFSEDQLRELGTFLKGKIAAVRETINTRAKIEQQQILAYNNSYANLGEFRDPYLNTKFIMNPYINMTEIIQQDQNLEHYEAQNNIADQKEEMQMMMMKGDGASCSQGISNFDGSQDNSYGYFLNENCFQNYGIQTEMMEKVVVNEPLMSYEEMLLLLNWQGDFPELAQAHDHQGFYV